MVPDRTKGAGGNPICTALVAATILFSIAGLLPRALAQDASHRGIAIVGPSGSLVEIPYYGRVHALVVGINRYKTFPPLQYAENDAAAVDKILQQYLPAKVTVNSLYGRHATKAAIIASLSEHLAKASQGGDAVIFFFAGHGVTLELQDGKQQGCIVPYDGDPSAAAESLISMDLLKVLAWKIPARHVLLVFDSCYSGFALSRSVPQVEADTEAFLRKVLSKKATQVLTAGGRNELSTEAGGHGIFTEKFLFALEGAADFNNDGVVTFSELGTFLRERVSVASGFKQTPLFGTLEGEGEFIFLHPNKDPEAIAKLRQNMDRFERHYDLAVRHLNQERWDQAKQELTAALSYKPDDFWAREKLSLIERNIHLPRRIQDRYGKEMLLIPTGSFVMGFDDLEVARPQRRERIDAFYIDRLEVTNSEYRRFLEDLKHKGGRERYRHPGEPPNHSYWPVSWSDPRFAKEDLPVTGISWYAAYAFAKWLDKRLPTEKEWEKAARGSEGSLYPWGNEWLVDSVDAPAGSEIRKIRNDTSVYGIQDLAGSVQEWVADVDQDYLGQSVPRDSQGRSFSVLRGGFFLRRQPKDFVNFGRTFRHPESVYFYVGFRCAKDASESKQPPPADRFVGLVGLPSAAAGKQDFPGL